MKLIISIFGALAFLGSYNVAFGQLPHVPQVTWNYYNQPPPEGPAPNSCESKCDQRFLGQCVTYIEVCNFRSEKELAVWNDQYKAIVDHAMRYMALTINLPHTQECIAKHAVAAFQGMNPVPDYLAAAKSEIYALGRAPRWPNFNIFIHTGMPGPAPGVIKAGWAWVQRNAYVPADGSLRWDSDINITISKEFLDHSIAKSRSVEVDVAGVIFHEFLHQMGWGHPEGNYDDGNFVTVAGDCVSTMTGDPNRVRGPHRGQKLGLTSPDYAYPQ